MLAPAARAACSRPPPRAPGSHPPLYIPLCPSTCCFAIHTPDPSIALLCTGSHPCCCHCATQPPPPPPPVGVGPSLERVPGHSRLGGWLLLSRVSSPPELLTKSFERCTGATRLPGGVRLLELLPALAPPQDLAQRSVSPALEPSLASLLFHPFPLPSPSPRHLLPEIVHDGLPPEQARQRGEDFGGLAQGMLAVNP